MECRYIDLFAKPVKHQVYDDDFNSDVTRKLFENLDKLVEIHEVSRGFVAQFSDMLAWFTRSDWKELTEPSKTSTLVKRQLIRGNNEKLFNARTLGDGVRIFRIDGSGTEAEAFELKESAIIFFEPDNESIEKNSKKQSIYVVDDTMKMRHLVSEADEHFHQD